MAYPKRGHLPIFCLLLTVLVVPLLGCGSGGAIRSSQPHAVQRASLRVVNRHPQNVRVSVVRADGGGYYLGTVNALSTKDLRVPAGLRESTVRLALVAHTRNFRYETTGAVRFGSERPVGSQSPYTIEEVNLSFSDRIELHIGRFLIQSKVVAMH